MHVTPLYADNGFGDLKALVQTAGAVDVFPSYIFKTPGAINHHIKKASSFVTYISGPSESVLGKSSWIIGEMARMSRKGQPLYRFQKEDECLRVILAIASKMVRADETEIRLAPLVILHHTPTSEVKKKYTDLLQGTHVVLGNNLQRKIHIEPEDIQLVREGDGSYFWALHKQAITLDQMVFVYDLGGKTANIAAYQGGELIEGSRFTLRQGGTYSHTFYTKTVKPIIVNTYSF